jgi:hypothetical protein
METGNSAPVDLARSIRSYLTARGRKSPSQVVLRSLLECLFAASLKSEEGERVLCHIAYIDPRKPDPKPPKRIVRNRWTPVPLTAPIDFTVPNLTKLAKASDPRSSSLAVYRNKEKGLVIWGLVDQGNEYHDFTNFDASSGMPRPGLFQVSIAGLGHLVAHDGLTKIAELRVNILVTSELNALWSGTVRHHFDGVIAGIRGNLVAYLGEEPYERRGHWNESLESEVVTAICRLMLRVQGFRHGGAFLITPEPDGDLLRVKYPLRYSRLRDAIARGLQSRIEESNASDEISTQYIDKEEDDIPVMLYLDEAVARYNAEDSELEITGAVWFMSLLSRVDGVVLLTQDLEVRGFGVEIVCAEAPTAVFLAQDSDGKKAREMSYELYGTRHRSVMRYCDKVPGSIGFVISQDGDVRAITKVDERLVVFDNLRLQAHAFPKESVRKSEIRDAADAS